MSSDRVALLGSLLSKTESNIKLIQEFGRAFLCAVLNEWRYATRHVVNAMVRPDDEEEKPRYSADHLNRHWHWCVHRSRADFSMKIGRRDVIVC